MSQTRLTEASMLSNLGMPNASIIPVLACKDVGATWSKLAPW